MNYSSIVLIGAATFARLGFFLFGLYQDAYLPVKYTDIDYLVFSDAAHYFVQGGSPYQRETYRYTPLLAWMLSPNEYWYSFGKFVFMVCDLLTGLIIMALLKKVTTSTRQYLILSSIWLLNPMVITISTRGSSESVLTVFIMLSVYFTTQASTNKFNYNNFQFWGAIFLGLAIHFKIYPIIYLPSFMLYIGGNEKPLMKWSENIPLVNLLTWSNLKFAVVAISSTGVLSYAMYHIYGYEFLYNAYLYHLTRIDHRHNFSVYNVALYFKSAFPTELDAPIFQYIEKLTFLPQILVSTVIIPLIYAKSHFIPCLFLQTFAFVLFNKVITSQYFIWFLIFLPHYLVSSRLLRSDSYKLAISVLVFWVVSQGAWLYFAYNLEFLGLSTFNNGLFQAAALFYLCNCWMLGVFMDCLGK